MAKLSLNKAALHQETAKLIRFKQYLPSLDLKRRKLIAERSQAEHQFLQTEQSIRRCRDYIAENLPMLADANINLAHAVNISKLTIGSEIVMGNSLPILERLDVSIKPYSMFDWPHWVDQALEQFRLMVELKIRQQIDQERLAILEQAVKKITQRVNLFDKVLIPKTEMNIKRIRVFLSDAERSAMVRAKITKQKRMQGGSQWP